MNLRQRIDFLNQNYDLYNDFKFDGSIKYFGDKANRKCRFCGKTDKG